MEILEEVIAKATGLELEGINFYRERKLSDKAIEEFVESELEKSRLIKIGKSYINLAFVSRPWRFVLFVIMEYLTLDGRFMKCYGYHFMLASHFRHSVKINFPYYLKQSLSISVQAIQKDPNGEHVFHEGLMVLIMNVLKSKRIVRNRGRIKDVDYETEGSIQEKGYDFETQDEAEGGKENLNKGTKSRSKKKKRVVGHSESKN